MVELSVGRAGGWYYPLYRAVGCRRWKWSVVDGQAIRFAWQAEGERFMWAMVVGLAVQGVWCCVLGSS